MSHPAIETMLRNQAHATRFAGKRFLEVTVGDMVAMTPEMQAAWHAEWWHRATRDSGCVQGDYDRIGSRQRYELGE